MIFVTVGSQLPFIRLINIVDHWAKLNPKHEVFAQIGDTELTPKYIQYVFRLSPKEYREKTQKAKVIVGHVGMGTIITGIDLNKPMVLMPRLSQFGEHRNDHQLSTVEHFADVSSLQVVTNQEEFDCAMGRVLTDSTNRIEAEFKVSEALLTAISDFVRS